MREFYSAEDLGFLDRICGIIERLEDVRQRTLARSALVRTCMKKTTSREIHGRGDPSSGTAPPVLLRLGLELKTVQQGTQRVGHSPSLPCDE